MQQMVDLAGAQQRLGRNAAPVQADAAQMFPLHDGGLHAKLRRPDGRDIAAGTAAQRRSGRSSAQPCDVPSASAGQRVAAQLSCVPVLDQARRRDVHRSRSRAGSSSARAIRCQPQFSATARCARCRISARPMPVPRCAGSTNRSSRNMFAARLERVERVVEQRQPDRLRRRPPREWHGCGAGGANSSLVAVRPPWRSLHAAAAHIPPAPGSAAERQATSAGSPGGA